MAISPKSVRKTVTFDSSAHDLALLDAIDCELVGKQYRSFGDLCKAALHQFLLSREPTQSVILFMELERKIASLQSRSDRMEEMVASSMMARLEALEAQMDSVNQLVDQPVNQPVDQHITQLTAEGVTLVSDEQSLDPTLKSPAADPLLERLAPLLEDF